MFKVKNIETKEIIQVLDTMVDDMRAIADYMENGGLVDHMNNAGLSFGAMALILTAISNECDRILDEMNKEER